MSNLIVVTKAGAAEIVNAEQSGTAPVVISAVGYGTGQYTPTDDLIALQGEFKRLTTIAGGAVSSNAIHLTARDDSTDTYTVYEVGLYTESGTLFAVYSQTTPILQKAAKSQSLMAIDIAVTDFSVQSVTFGDTNFMNPPATTERQGIVELATDEETKIGTDSNRAVTPKSLEARKATKDKTGLVKIGEGVNIKEDGTISVDTKIRDEQDSWSTRIPSSSYAVGDVVGCPYKRNLELVCSIGGKSAAGPLNKEALVIGATITDGEVSWVVVPKLKTINNKLPDENGNFNVDLSVKFDHTVNVVNADINTLLEDKAYSCSGSIRNGAVACTFCIVRAYDTGAPISGNIVQIQYIPQTDNTVRVFTRCVVNGATFGRWLELGGVKTVNDYAPNESGNVVLPMATTTQAGLFRAAGESDELNCQCDSAALTPKNLYHLADYRRASTAYVVGDKVECKYNFELFLECTTAGTTSETALDTAGVVHNQVISDGTAQWTVRTKVRSVNGSFPDESGNVALVIQNPTDYVTSLSVSGRVITYTKKDGTTGTITTQDSTNFLPLTGGTVTGWINAPGFKSTSDARLKSKRKTIESALSLIGSIEGQTYVLKGHSGRHAGIIAQDIERVLPEAVATGKDGFKSVDYNAVTALLVNAVKELKAEVEVLRNGG